MKATEVIIATLAVALLLALGPSAWGASKYKVVHNFGPFGGSDGSQPYGPLLADSHGSLYGVTANGGGSGCGGYGCGVLFELTKQANGKWSEQILHDFADNGDGAWPEGNLVQDGSGDLYGIDQTDDYDPHGVFELTPGSGGWGLSLIWTQGASPGLLLDQGGDLYGFFSKDLQGIIGELSPSPKGWIYTDLYDGYCRFCAAVRVECGDVGELFSGCLSGQFRRRIKSGVCFEQHGLTSVIVCRSEKLARRRTELCCRETISVHFYIRNRDSHPNPVHQQNVLCRKRSVWPIPLDSPNQVSSKHQSKSQCCNHDLAQCANDERSQTLLRHFAEVGAQTNE